MRGVYSSTNRRQSSWSGLCCRRSSRLADVRDMAVAAPGGARRVNTAGTRMLAELADACGARLVLVSTDLVFDGERPPYREEDPAVPSSVYGRTKLEAEAAVRAMSSGVVARLSLLYGP